MFDGELEERTERQLERLVEKRSNKVGGNSFLAADGKRIWQSLKEAAEND